MCPDFNRRATEYILENDLLTPESMSGVSRRVRSGEPLEQAVKRYISPDTFETVRLRLQFDYQAQLVYIMSSVPLEVSPSSIVTDTRQPAETGALNYKLLRVPIEYRTRRN